MTMLHCIHCRKDVLILGVSLNAARAEDIAGYQATAAAAGQLILFNPPPIEPYHCPVCGTDLITHE